MTTTITEHEDASHLGRETATGVAEGGVPWVNATGDETWVADPRLQPHLDRVGREIANWVKQVRGATRPSIFNRAAYVAPDNPYAQFSTARSAVDNDDVISGVADVTEGLIFQGIKWESTEADEADVFNQISRDLNLDEFVRQWYREEFTYSQVVVGVWWGRKVYKIRGTTPPKQAGPNGQPDGASPVLGAGGDEGDGPVGSGGGTGDPGPGDGRAPKRGSRRKKTYEIVVPLAMTMLDPQKVVPLRPGPFGQDRLAWHASEEEYAQVIAGDAAMSLDPVMSQFLIGPLNIDPLSAEGKYLAGLGLDPKRLVLMNPSSVWRFTRTKSDYERFSSVRLKSTFPLLDLKQQLMEADRVNLVGAANFILLVKQGSKDEPAKQEEIDNLKENFKVLAKLPVIIGDHRLSIEIVTPDQQFVLDTAKYDTLDRRILNRTLGALSIGGSGQRNESTLTIARGVARLLENRRHMMKRELEREIARGIVDHPLNEGKFKDEPNLTFTPRNVQLDSDQSVTAAILALRTQKEISRETVLEYFGIDQAVEALRREYEETYYDPIFKTAVPFNSPGNEGAGGQGNTDAGTPAANGANGGRPAGGGKSPDSPQARAKKKTPSGNPSTGGNS